MNKHETYNYETTIDALLDYINTLPKPIVCLLNLERYQQMMEAAATLQKLLSETMEEGSISVEIDKDFHLGSISVELMELSVEKPSTFIQVISSADSFEIYPLTNGNIRVDITFHHVLKGIYSKEARS